MKKLNEYPDSCMVMILISADPILFAFKNKIVLPKNKLEGLPAMHNKFIDPK